MKTKFILLRKWSARVKMLIETEGTNLGQWTIVHNDTSWHAYMILDGTAANYFAGFVRGVLLAANQDARGDWAIKVS